MRASIYAASRLALAYWLLTITGVLLKHDVFPASPGVFLLPLAVDFAIVTFIDYRIAREKSS